MTPLSTPDLHALVEGVYADLAPFRGEGAVADYIPQLARVDPQSFGLAVATTAAM